MTIRKAASTEEEQVILECVEMTKDFEDIKEYVLMKGNVVVGYIEERVYQIPLSDILYFEAVGEQVFAYTADDIYSIKNRLYEIEELYSDRKFIRCSKSVVVNILKIESFRPALDSRFYAKMKNGEEILISRMYAKNIKKKLMEG
ncbi:MAG: LytTR family DNA-binding domain-containing protein [Oscillospiraceae bacterium]